MNARVSKLPIRNGKSRQAELPFRPKQVWVDKQVADHPNTLRILNKLKGVEIDFIDDIRALKRPTDFAVAKRQLILTAHQGNAFKPCQGISGEYLCCNYRILDLCSGCPMDCSYCILQSYLANNPITCAYVNIESILAELGAFLSAHPSGFFRIGTGELADSLALDPILDYASVLIPFFASKNNALLELKTKSSFVDHLLELKHRNRTVISWSVNRPEIIASDERDTASLDERLSAAERAVAAGYGVGFHFDPIILTGDSEADVAAYSAVIDMIFERIRPQQIAWISMGLLRYPSDLADIATKRFPKTRIFTGELIPAGGKVRYLRFIREALYKPLWEKLKTKLPANKIYLCMETEAVWGKIDPTIKSNCCIEKRLCNTEAIQFDYSAH